MSQDLDALRNEVNKAKGEPGGKAHDKRSKDGITLYMKLCNNTIFDSAMDKLEECRAWDGKTTYNFLKLADAYESGKGRYQRAWKKLIEKHVVHEEVMVDSKAIPGEKVPKINEKTGKPIMKPKMRQIGGGRMDFEYKDKEAWMADFHALNVQTFHVKAFKLTMEELLAAGLTPRELRMCVSITEDADPGILASFNKSVLTELQRELGEGADDDEDDGALTEENAPDDSDDDGN